MIHNAIRHGVKILSGIENAAGFDNTSGAGVERLGETLTPVIDHWSKPEWSLLRDEILWSTFQSSGAVVGEFSYIAVTVPVGSNLLLIVDNAGIRCAGSSGPGLGIRSVVAATLSLSPGADNRDTRYAAAGAAVRFVGGVEVWTGSDPGNSVLGGLVWEEVFATATAYTAVQSVPYIVKPGMAFGLLCNTANTSMQGNISGRIRPAFPGEL